VGFLGKKKGRKTTLFQKIATNPKMNFMDFKCVYPLAIVWLCILKKTRRFYHNYEEFGGILKVRHCEDRRLYIIIAPTVEYYP
jgi:hypothetical protein